MPLLGDTIDPVLVRQQINLPKEPLALGSIDEYHQLISSRIRARAAAVSLRLDQAAGQYNWPFSFDVASNLYQGRTSDDIQETLDDYWTLAQDAVRAFVFCDLFTQASERSPEYTEKAKNFCAQGMEILKSLEDAIKASVIGGGGNEAQGAGLHLIQVLLPKRHRGGNGTQYGRPYGGW